MSWSRTATSPRTISATSPSPTRSSCGARRTRAFSRAPASPKKPPQSSPPRKPQPSPPPNNDGTAPTALKRCCRRPRPARNAEALLIGDRSDAAVELRQFDREFLVVSLRAVLQKAQRDRLAQLDRRFCITAPVNTDMDAVTIADIVRQLVQFAVDRQLAGTGTGIIVQRHSVI